MFLRPLLSCSFLSTWMKSFVTVRLLDILASWHVQYIIHIIIFIIIYKHQMKRPCSRPSEAFTFLCVLLFVQRSFLKCDRRICVNSSFPWRQSGFWTTFLRSARRSRSRSRGRSRGRGVPPPPRPRREELSRRPPQPPPPPPPRPGWQLSGGT